MSIIAECNCHDSRMRRHNEPKSHLVVDERIIATNLAGVRQKARQTSARSNTLLAHCETGASLSSVHYGWAPSREGEKRPTSPNAPLRTRHAHLSTLAWLRPLQSPALQQQQPETLASANMAQGPAGTRVGRTPARLRAVARAWFLVQNGPAAVDRPLAAKSSDLARTDRRRLSCKR